MSWRKKTSILLAQQNLTPTKIATGNRGGMLSGRSIFNRIKSLSNKESSRWLRTIRCLQAVFRKWDICEKSMTSRVFRRMTPAPRTLCRNVCPSSHFLARESNKSASWPKFPAHRTFWRNRPWTSWPASKLEAKTQTFAARRRSPRNNSEHHVPQELHSTYACQTSQPFQNWAPISSWCRASSNLHTWTKTTNQKKFPVTTVKAWSKLQSSKII